MRCYAPPVLSLWSVAIESAHNIEILSLHYVAFQNDTRKLCLLCKGTRRACVRRGVNKVDKGILKSRMQLKRALCSQVDNGFRFTCEPNLNQRFKGMSNLSVRTDQNKKPPDWVAFVLARPAGFFLHFQDNKCVSFANALKMLQSTPKTIH